jgi:hypothetical protein
MFQDNTIRFKYSGSGMGFHNYAMYIRGDLTDEGSVLQGFVSSGFGTLISFEPVSGLYIGAATGSVGNSRSFNGELKEDGFVDALKSAQVGLGYTIPDIGVIRAQYVGFLPKEWAVTKAAAGDTPAEYGYVNDSLDKTLNNIGDASKIQFAFNVKAIKGIDIDIGANIKMPEVKDYYSDLAKTTKTQTVTTQPEYVVGIGMDTGGATLKPFRLWTVISAKLGGYTETKPASGSSTKVSTGTDIAVMLNPWYYLRDDLILSADLFFDTRTGSDLSASSGTARGGDADPTLKPKADAKNNYFDVGFGLYVRKNIPGGDIRAGVTFKVPGGEAHEGASVQVFVPVMMNYSF